MKLLSDIYFFNALGLANDLKNGLVDEVRALKHLIATIILGGVGFDVPVSVEFNVTDRGTAHILINVFLFIITGVVSYYGTWLTYQANTKGDGKDYFLRFAALSLPIGIQLVLPFLVIGLVIALMAMSVTSSMGVIGIYLTEGAFYILGIAFLVTFFLRMRHYIEIASKANE